MDNFDFGLDNEDNSIDFEGSVIDPVSAPVDPKTLEHVVLDADLALNGSMSQDDIRNSVLSGNTQTLETAASLNDTLELQNAQDNIVIGDPLSTTITDDEFKIVATATIQDNVDNTAALSKAYAKRYMNLAVANFNELPESGTESTDSKLDFLDIAEQSLATSRAIEEQKTLITKQYQKNVSWAEWGVGAVLSAVPGVYQYSLSGAIEDNPFASHTLVLGKNIREQNAFIYSLTPENAKRVIQETYDSFTNKVNAKQWLDSVVGYKGSDDTFHNVLAVIDVAPFALITKGTRAAAKTVITKTKDLPIKSAEALKNLGGSIKEGKLFSKETVTAVGDKLRIDSAFDKVRFRNITTIVQNLGSMGSRVRGGSATTRDLAAEIGEFEKVAKYDRSVPVDPTDADIASSKIPGMADPIKTMSGMKEDLTAKFDSILTKIEELSTDASVSVRELGDTVRDALVDDAVDKLGLAYDRVRTPSPLRTEWVIDGKSNQSIIKITVGTSKGTMFKSRPAAEKMAEALGYRDVGIVALGTKDSPKFVLEVHAKPDFSAGTVRAAYHKELVTEAGAAEQTAREAFEAYKEGPKGGLMSRLIDPEYAKLRAEWYKARSNMTAPSNSVAGWFDNIRSREYILPTRILTANKVNAAATSKVRSLTSEAMSTLRKQYGDPTKDLERYMQHERTLQTEEGIGRFSDTPEVLMQRFNDHLGRLPTENEIGLYDGFLQVSDLELSINRHAIWAEKSENGIVNLTASYADVYSEGSRIEATFEGKLVSEFGSTRKAVVVLLIDGQAGTFSNTSKLSADVLSDIKKGKLKIIHLTPDGAANAATKYFDDELVQYVIVNKTPKISGLRREDMIPFNGGGHLEYTRDSFFVKQPVFENGVYRTDSTVFSSRTQSVADSFTKGFNEVMDILNNYQKKGLTFKEAKAVAATHADATLSKIVTDKSGDDFVKMFIGKGALKKDTKAVVTPDGRSSIDVFDIETVWGHTDIVIPGNDGHNLFANMHFTRNALEKNGPLLSTSNRTPGKGLDPLLSVPENEGNMVNIWESALSGLDRAMSSTISREGHNQLVTQYAHEFKDVFDFTDFNKEVLIDPRSWLMNPKYKEKSIGTNKRATADNFRRAAMEQLGYRTPGERAAQAKTKYWIQWLSSRNSKTASAMGDLLSLTTHNGDRTISESVRQLNFIRTLGSGDPFQVLQQAQSIVGVAAFGGVRNTARAMMSADLVMSVKWGNTTIDQISKAGAKRLGWEKESHFSEMLHAYTDGGIGIIDGNAMEMNVTSTASLNPSLWSKTKNVGQFFFATGDQVGRLSAYMVSYGKWRKANPTAVFSDAAKREVQRLQDDLTTNMTSQSRAEVQKGGMGVLTQFMSHRLRLSEQFLGYKWSPTEKIHAMSVYSTLYGAPLGLSVWGSGFFPSEDIADLVSGGKVNTEDFVVNAFQKGVIAASANWVSQEFGDGTTYEIDALAPAGTSAFTAIFKAVTGDSKNIRATDIFGPTVGTIDAVTKFVMPLLGEIKDVYYGTDTVPDAQHLRNAAKLISGTSKLEKVIWALNTRTYLDKNNSVILNDYSAWDAFLQGTLGLTRQDLGDFYSMSGKVRAFKSAAKVYEKAARKLMVQAYSTEDLEKREQYRSQALYILQGSGMDVVSRGRSIKRLLSEVGDTKFHRANKQFININPERKKAFYGEMKGILGDGK